MGDRRWDVTRSLGLVLMSTSLWLARCTCESTPRSDESPAPRALPSASPSLDDALGSGDTDAPTPLRERAHTTQPQEPPQRRCPAEMVDVDGLYCIDRYEVSLVERRQGRPLSPFYPPTRQRTRALFEEWSDKRETLGPAWARALSPPEPPEWQASEDFEPEAVVVADALPSGYLSGVIAGAACSSAGKRLCSETEWVTACRGERDQPFPYGAEYEQGACNVMRRSHPAALLHENASLGHLDPRLNLTADDDGPLLQRTGASPRCKSRWGDDAIYDMVGNLDEWIADEGGTFLGGFFSRQTNKGCASRISSHPYGYFDYSLGTRCCL